MEVSIIKRIFVSIGRAIEGTNAWITRIMAGLILTLLGVTLYGVIMRYVFHLPPDWGWQVLLLIFTPVVLLPGGYLLHKDAHIRLDLIYGHWSERGKAISNSVTFIAFLIFSVVMIISTIDVAWTSTSIGENYARFPFKGPVYPKKIALAVGFVLFFLQGVIEFARNIYFLKKGKKNEEPNK